MYKGTRHMKHSEDVAWAVNELFLITDQGHKGPYRRMTGPRCILPGNRYLILAYLPSSLSRGDSCTHKSAIHTHYQRPQQALNRHLTRSNRTVSGNCGTDSDLFDYLHSSTTPRQRWRSAGALLSGSSRLLRLALTLKR